MKWTELRQTCFSYFSKSAQFFSSSKFLLDHNFFLITISSWSHFKMKFRRLESIVMAFLTLVLSLLLTTANAQATQPTSYGRIKTKDDFSTSSRPVMIREVSQHTPTQTQTQAPTQAPTPTPTTTTTTTTTKTQTQTLSGIFLEKTASDTQSWNKGEKVWMAKIVTYVDDNFFYPTDCW